MLPGALVMLFAGPLSGVIANRRGPRVPLGLGALVAAVGLTLLAVDHGSEASIIAYNTILSVGIGLAFAAMPNLIVSAVPLERTGEATGFNAVVRSVGASLGSQVTASVLAGSAAAGSRVPTDSGFTEAFAVGAAVAIVAAAVTLLIPRDGEPRAPPRAQARARASRGMTANVQPAARPLRQDAARNRERVVEAAAALFAERGMSVGVPEVAERAGVGKATVYRSFPSKENLIAAVLEQRMALDARARRPGRAGARRRRRVPRAAGRDGRGVGVRPRAGRRHGLQAAAARAGARAAVRARGHGPAGGTRPGAGVDPRRT